MSDDSSDQTERTLVKKAVENFIPGATSILISAITDRKDIISAVSHVVQRQAQEGWLKALANEWEELCKMGKAKPEYLQTNQGQACQRELLDSLDKDKPDGESFEAMKKIFLAAATSDSSEWEDPRPQEFMQICRELTSTQLIILGIAYKLHKKMSASEKYAIHGFEAWNQVMVQGSDGKLSVGLIMRNEQKLIDMRLIGDRMHQDRSGIQRESDVRLDSLGLELCEYLEKYESQ